MKHCQRNWTEPQRSAREPMANESEEHDGEVTCLNIERERGTLRELEGMLDVKTTPTS